MRKGRKVHHAALPYQRMGEFMANLRLRPGIAARALEFTILVAGRTDEVLGARWSEIDWSAQTWTIPGERMKARVEHRVPLSEPALDILRAMKVMSGGSGERFLFPGSGRPGGKSGNMTLLDELSKMNADRQAAGLPAYTDPAQGNRPVTPHGMRSAFRDWAAECTNFPRELAEKALAHLVGDEVERSYQRGELLEKRRHLMDAWVEYCGKPSVTTGDVVPLHQKISA
jgi:integrase